MTTSTWGAHALSVGSSFDSSTGLVQGFPKWILWDVYKSSSWKGKVIYDLISRRRSAGLNGFLHQEILRAYDTEFPREWLTVLLSLRAFHPTNASQNPLWVCTNIIYSRNFCSPISWQHTWLKSEEKHEVHFVFRDLFRLCTLSAVFDRQCPPGLKAVNEYSASGWEDQTGGQLEAGKQGLCGHLASRPVAPSAVAQTQLTWLSSCSVAGHLHPLHTWFGGPKKRPCPDRVSDAP